MAYSEKSARGPSLSSERKQKDDEVHHVSLFAADGASPQNQKWTLCTYSDEGDNSKIGEQEFTDGHALLAAIADVAGIEPDEDDKGGY